MASSSPAEKTAAVLALANPAFRSLAGYMATAWTPRFVVAQRAVLGAAVPEAHRARFDVFVDYLAKVALPEAAARRNQPVLDFRRRLQSLSSVPQTLAEGRLLFEALPSAVAARPADIRASAVLLDVSDVYPGQEDLDACLRHVAAAVEAVGHGGLTVALNGWRMFTTDEALPLVRRHLLRHADVAYVVAATGGLACRLDPERRRDALPADAEDLRRLVVLHPNHLNDTTMSYMFPDGASADAAERRRICLKTHRAFYASPAAPLLAAAEDAARDED